MGEGYPRHRKRERNLGWWCLMVKVVKGAYLDSLGQKVVGERYEDDLKKMLPHVPRATGF